MSAVAINVIGSATVTNHYRAGIVVNVFDGNGDFVTKRHYLRFQSFSTGALYALSSVGIVADGVGILTEKELDNGREFLVTDK